MGAIVWGAWQYAGGNGMRVGVSTDVSSVGNGSSSVTFTYNIYTENQYAYSDSIYLNFSGDVGTSSIYFSNTSGGGSQVWRATKTYTYYYAGGSYGSSPGTVTFNTSISGTYNGVTPGASITTTIPARPVALPAAVTGVTATRTSDTTATVGWTNHATSGAPYTSHTLAYQYITGGGTWGPWIVIASPSGGAGTQAITGIPANSASRYEVRANNTVGSSGYTASNYIYMTPAAPSGVVSTISSSGTQITTAWTNNHYADSTNSLTVERSVNGGAYAVVASGLSYTTTSWTDTAPGGGSNTYRVKAVQANGSLASAYGTGNTVSTVVPPLAPTNLAPNGISVDLGNTAVTLTWKHNPGADNAAQSHFWIETSSDGGTTWVALPGATNVASAVSSFVVPAGTLANGPTAYQWRVWTQGATSGAAGPKSAAATITGSDTPTATLDPTHPAPTTATLPLVVNWTYAQGQGSAQAQWEAHLFAADGVTQLEVQQGYDATSSVTFTTQAQDGTAYVVSVRVRSAAGLWSGYSIATTLVALPVPALVDVTPTYQQCTGSMVLSLAGRTPLGQPANETNLVTNPAMRGVSGVIEMRRNQLLNPSFRATSATAVEVRRNYVSDPNCTTVAPWNNPTGTGTTVALDTTTAYSGTSSIKLTAGTSAPDPTYGYATYLTPVTVSIGGGTQLQWRVRLRAPVTTTVTVWPTMNSGFVPGVAGVQYVLPANTWVEAVFDYMPPGSVTNVYLIVGTLTASAVVNIDTVFIGDSGRDNFDGSTPAQGPYTYSWVGAANASQSIATTTALEVKRNPHANPSWRTTAGTNEVRRNICTNPGAEGAGGFLTNNGAFWTTSFDTTVKHSGTRSSKSTPVGSTSTTMMSDYDVGGSGLPVVVGTVYTASCYVTHSALTTATATLQVYFLDAGGAQVGAVQSVTVAAIPSGTSTWTRVAVTTVAAPAGSVTARLLMIVSKTTGNSSPSECAWVDDVLLEASGTLLPYFDGTNIALGGLTYSWTGAANASASIASGPALTSAPFTAYISQPGVVGWVDQPGIYQILAKSDVASGGILGFSALDPVPVGSGQWWAGRFKVRVVSSPGSVVLNPALGCYDSQGNNIGFIASTTVVVPADGSWLDLAVPTTAQTPNGTVTVRWLVYASGTVKGSTYLEFKEASLSRKLNAAGQLPEAYFDGFMPAADGLTYAWTSTPDNSASYATGARLANWQAASGPNAGAYAASQSVGVLRRTSMVYSANAVGVAGQFWGARITMWAPGGSASVRVAVHDGNIYVADLGFITLTSTPTEYLLAATAALTGTAPRIYIYPSSADEVRVSGATMERVLGIGLAPGPVFDGSSASSADLSYSWTGTPDASASIMTGRAVIGVLSNGPIYQVTGADGRMYAFTSTGTYLYASGAASAGKYYAASVLVTGPVGASYTVYSSDNVVGAVMTTVSGTIPVSGSVRVFLTSTAPTAAGCPSVAFGLSSTNGGTLGISEAILEQVAGPNITLNGYFDGSTPDESTMSFAWTGTPDASTSLGTGRAEAAVDSVNLERSVDGGNTWVMLATGLPVPVDFVDTLPVTNGLNEYRATSVSTAPTYRTNDPVSIMADDGSEGSGQWIFLAYGDAFTQVLRFHNDPSISETAGRVRAMQAFLGRTKPVLLVGANTSRQVSASGTLISGPRTQGCPDTDDCRWDSPASDWVDMAHDAEIVCYRDYTGRRLFGMLGDISATDGIWPATGTIAVTVDETDFVEAYGAAVSS